MLKSNLRDAMYDLFGIAIQSPLMSAARFKFFSNRQNIIFYHAIWKKEDPRQNLFGGVDLEIFKANLQTLDKHFSFVDISEIINQKIHVKDGKPTIAITFDDGFDLVESGILNALEEVGVRATAFINSDAYMYRRLLWQHAFGVVKALKGEQLFIRCFNKLQEQEGRNQRITSFGEYIAIARLWPDQHTNNLRADKLWAMAEMPSMSAILKEYHPYMDKTGLDKWVSNGHLIGCHSKSHFFGSLLKAQDLEDEYFEPAAQLCNDFGVKQVPMAYPFGDRLPENLEKQIQEKDTFSCLLGTDRLSFTGEHSGQLDRIEVDYGLNRFFYGRPLIRALRKQDAPMRT